MPDLISVSRDRAPWFRRLYLPAYRISEAARYVHVSPQALSNWHYRPIREIGPALPHHDRGTPLSYLELVEVAIVAVFRRFNVPFRNIATTRDYMAQTFNSEYPFAEYRFKTDGFHLLMNLSQAEPRIGTDDLIVADKSGQIGWASMMVDRLFEFDYDQQYELALRWWVAGRDSRVVVDPRIAFGAPMVRGVATWVIKGRHLAGETISDIKEDFDLEDVDVVDALKFEDVEVAA